MIQVGEVLDKYELLERVGQGGMAVVYRGVDRSLKRVVAIKILHKHLSDYQEARDRFEREAQAVAKLRHENILEIYDYSGAEAAEAAGSSYIVTEFIEGGTLKQVITDRPITFPEVGAMVVLQVCRALAHAHAAGILHRDVKPENIMIRSDGVVKLMDFGISHMVDLERLTVTGQLLGSPAYMAPEHVEGRQLDFRTDVFAVGIVLYQLTVGKLPFEGKNPHEVLKRIADCKFVDPREVNARIGNRLGRIILRAMAAEPRDRYPSVGEMVIALENYLEESGIAADKVASELGRYFSSPGPYEQALEDRLIDHLTRRGQQLLADGDRTGALDVFDRVLTIDADNEKVIAILDGINRRTRIKAGAMALAAAAMISAGAYAIHRRGLPPPPAAPDDLAHGTSPVTGPATQIGSDDPAPPAIDAAPLVVVELDAGSGGPRPTATDASDLKPVGVATVFRVYPSENAEYQVEGDPKWLEVPGDGVVKIELLKETVVQVRHECCQQETKPLQPGTNTMITLAALPAIITPRCPDPSSPTQPDPKISVNIDGKPGRLDKEVTITFAGGSNPSRNVTVEFLGEGVDPTPIRKKVKYRETVEVSCVRR